MPDLLHTVGLYMPVVAAGLSLLGGLVALVLSRRTPIRERVDRGNALRIGAGFGLLAAGPVTLFLGMFGSAWGGDPLTAFAAAAIFAGIPIFAIAMGAALTGYILVAQRGPGTRAVAGAVAGPLVLGAITLAGLGLVQISRDLYVAQVTAAEDDAVTARSTPFRLAVDGVEAVLSADGSVAVVRLIAVVESDVAVHLQAIPDKWTEPHFRLTPDGGRLVDGGIEIDSPDGSPDAWAAGAQTRYTLTFDVAAGGATAKGQPGTWLLQMSFTGEDGEAYRAEAAVEVRPNGG